MIWFKKFPVSSWDIPANRRKYPKERLFPYPINPDTVDILVNSCKLKNIYTLSSKSSEVTLVWVRVPPSAPRENGDLLNWVFIPTLQIPLKFLGSYWDLKLSSFTAQPLIQKSPAFFAALFPRLPPRNTKDRLCGNTFICLNVNFASKATGTCFKRF